MKRTVSILLVVLLSVGMLPLQAFAADYSLTCSGSVKNTITISGLSYEPKTAFNGSTATFHPELAELSAAMIMTINSSSAVIKENLEKLGFGSVTEYDFSRRDNEEYKTGYVTATMDITRNGKPCKLLACMVSTYSYNANDIGSMMADLDFMNYEMTGEGTDYNSNQVLTFTEAAKLILNGKNGSVTSAGNLGAAIDEMAASGEDYLVWVTGQSRGGAVGNYLSKLLVDRYGTDHVAGYLFSVPNVDKEAASENTSKYSCIFNIINPEDIVTYVPFGTDYPGWGFDRWGVDMILQSQSTAADAANTAMQAQYKAYVSTAPQDSMFLFDGNYYHYSGSEANGAAIKTVINSLVAAMPEVKDYYTGTVTFHNGISTVDKILYSFIKESYSQLSSGGLSSDSELIAIAIGTCKYSCDMQEFTLFAIRHATKYSDASELLIDVGYSYLAGNDIQIVAKEAILAHLPEVYISWLMAMRVKDGGYYQQTVFSPKAQSTVTSGGVTINSADCIFDDESFTAAAAPGGYSLGLTLGGGEVRPYGPVTLTIAGSGADYGWFVGNDGSSYRVDITESSSKLYVTLTDLNGRLFLFDNEGGARLYAIDSSETESRYLALYPETTAAGNTIVAASYSAAGKMTAASVTAMASAGGQLLKIPGNREADTVKAFLIDSSLKPVYGAVSVS